MQPVLEKASVDTAKLLISVTADQKQADEQAAIVAVDVSEANKVAAAVKVRNDGSLVLFTVGHGGLIVSRVVFSWYR